MDKIETASESENEVPKSRKSVRTTRGVPPLRYTHCYETFRPSYETRRKGMQILAITKQSAVELSHKTEFASTSVANISGQDVHQSDRSHEKRDIDECVHEMSGNSVRDEIVDQLKCEVAELRRQMQNMSVASDSAQQQHVYAQHIMKSPHPVSSTPLSEKNLAVATQATVSTPAGCRDAMSSNYFQTACENNFSSERDNTVHGRARVLQLQSQYTEQLEWEQQQSHREPAQQQRQQKQIQFEFDQQQHQQLHRQQEQKQTAQQGQQKAHINRQQQQQQQVQQAQLPVQPQPIPQFQSPQPMPQFQQPQPMPQFQQPQPMPQFQPPQPMPQFQPPQPMPQFQQPQAMPQFQFQQQPQLQQPQAMPQFQFQQHPRFQIQQQPRQQPGADGNNYHHFLSRQGAKDLPRFDGNPDDWMLFSTQYYRTTGICNFSLDDNLIRLQRCLHGPAREAVKALLVLPQSVDEIMQTLYERFGRDEYVIKSLINKTRRIPMPHEEEPHTIIEFATAVNNMVVTLQNLDRPDYLQNPQLMEDIEAKLPPMMSMMWANAVVGHVQYNIADLNNWIRQHARALSLRVLPKEFCTEKKERKPTHKVFAATDQQQASSVSKSSPSVCVCCKQQCVSLSKCTEFKQKSVEDRYTIVKKAFVCFSCLHVGHTSARCRKNMKCTMSDCGKRHNTLLHHPIEPAASASRDERETCAQSSTCDKRVLLKIVPVTLRFGETEIKTSALLDSGSTVTLLRADIASSLGVTGPVKPLCIQWADGSEGYEKDSRIINIDISGTYPGSRQYNINGAKTVQRLPLCSQSINKNWLVNKWPYLQSVPFEDYDNMQPGILIGEDHTFAMAPQRVVKHQPRMPIATKTPLGWVVSGCIADEPADVVSETALVYHVCDDSATLDELHRLVKGSFAMDDFGVKSNLAKGRSREDGRAMTVMETTAARIAGGRRWEIGLLWRDSNVTLPDSRQMALMRLKCLERRLDSDAVLRAAYTNQIDDYIAKGYFVHAERDSDTQQRTWFLPHFAVVNKLRVVFDAAAKAHGRSLNDFLMQGPDLLKALAGVLFRFRQRRVGFVGDIKEMYHRVAIRAVDQCSQLILWRGDDRQRDPDVFKMTAMTFGASCSPSAAMFIKDNNALQYATEFPDAAKAIVDNHYVDDCLGSSDDETAAANLIRDICYVHEQGGFEIRNWACSSQEVLQTIPESIRLMRPKQIASDQMERVLGVWWDPESDMFTFRFKHQDLLTDSAVPTKRQVLRVLMTVYDPLGMLAHVLIRGRIIMQFVWKSGIGWDDELQSPLQNMWLSWLQYLAGIDRVRVPRCYAASFSTSPTVELHVFCDASEQAYCAVAYFRILVGETVETAFVDGKARVAPLKTSTIPRLELQAALIGSRLASSIVAEHDIKPNRLVLWSDSRTVLSWIRAENRRFRQYAAQRVGEILEHTNVTDWRWVPTKQNVADDATRMNASDIDYASSGRWYTGPPFLKLHEREWPRETIIDACDADLEILETVYAINSVDYSLEFDKFSTISRAVRTVAYALRFADRARAKSELNTGKLSADELRRAETSCLIAVQHACFPEDLLLINDGTPVPKSSKLFKLCSRLGSDGLLRVGGRLDNLNADVNFTNPVFIDAQHRYCMLLLQKYHNRYDHQNDATVLNELRQKFWAIGSRRALKRFKQSCVECRIRKAVPEMQLMGQLPRVRLEYGVPPFTHTGVDYFGPMEVAVGRRREKRYGVLFTCMTCRAVHLDVAASLSTDSFLMAWRRFVARRGVPKEMFSDNGTNFRGADAEMLRARKEMDSEAVKAAVADRGVMWNFIPPGSPHFGGCWERMVRSIKSSLAVTLKNRRPPSDDLLHTLIVEAEHVVNSRPLTELPLDHFCDDVITPNHLLIGRSSADAPIGKFNDTDLILRKQWRASQRLADVFWATWLRSYLPNLTLRSKWQKMGRQLTTGDVVLVADPNEPRNSWPRGVIECTYPGTDGVVRVVDVRTTAGISRRPAHKICILIKSDCSPNKGSDLPGPVTNTGRENVVNRT